MSKVTLLLERLSRHMKELIHQEILQDKHGMGLTPHSTKKYHYIHKDGGVFRLDTEGSEGPGEWGLEQVKGTNNE